MKHYSTQPIYIFKTENPQNSESPNGPRRVLDFIALIFTSKIKTKIVCVIRKIDGTPLFWAKECYLFSDETLSEFFRIHVWKFKGFGWISSKKKALLLLHLLYQLDLTSKFLIVVNCKLKENPYFCSILLQCKSRLLVQEKWPPSENIWKTISFPIS